MNERQRAIQRALYLTARWGRTRYVYWLTTGQYYVTDNPGLTAKIVFAAPAGVARGLT